MAVNGAPARVVVVTNDGHLGDARVFLLYLVRWLRDNVAGGIDVLAWEGGPALDRLRYAADVQVLDELNQWRPARVFEVFGVRRVAQVLKGARLRWWLLRRRRAELLYVNGLDAARILAFLPRWPMRVVVHVHAMADVEAPTSSADREAVRRRTDVFVAASEEIADALADGWAIPRPGIVVHEYFVAGDDGPLTSPDPPSRADLGLADDDVVVGATGSPDWWARPEQFVLLAWELLRRRPDLPWRYLWIAEDPDERVLWPLRHDLRNAGVEARTVVWSGATPLDLLASMDVLTISTRDEPQELLLFEAAGAALPVVATDNLTGAIPGATAEVVPYLDVAAMADRVVELVTDERRRSAVVTRAQITARRHHDVSVGAPELLRQIGFRP